MNCMACGVILTSAGCINSECPSKIGHADSTYRESARVDHRALLREAADALDDMHHNEGCTDAPACHVTDLIRRLREAST